MRKSISGSFLFPRSRKGGGAYESDLNMAGKQSTKSKNQSTMMRRNKKMSEQNRNYEQIEEITLHFGKGTVEPFTAKDGREMLKIVIPNADRSDHTPWASFVLPAKAVHENQYGKGLWAKIPADGHTTLTKPYLAGQSEDGKNIWKDEKTTVSNRELKSMVEFYKKDLVPKYDIPAL